MIVDQAQFIKLHTSNVLNVHSLVHPKGLKPLSSQVRTVRLILRPKMQIVFDFSVKETKTNKPVESEGVTPTFPEINPRFYN